MNLRGSLSSISGRIAPYFRKESVGAVIIATIVSQFAAPLSQLYFSDNIAAARAADERGYAARRSAEEREYAERRAQEERQFAANREKIERARIAIANFRAEADSFIIVSGVFVTAVSQNNQVDEEARRQFVASLVKQRNLLAAASRYLPPGSESEIEAFQTALANLNDAASHVEGVRTMQGFWRRATDWALAREALYGRMAAPEG